MNDALQFKKELADSAHELLATRAFTEAVLRLRKRWFDELLTAEKVEDVLERKAMIKALEAIQVELAIMINDFKMARR